jgi:hypothetical protein
MLLTPGDQPLHKTERSKYVNMSEVCNDLNATSFIYVIAMPSADISLLKHASYVTVVPVYRNANGVF